MLKKLVFAMSLPMVVSSDNLLADTEFEDVIPVEVVEILFNTGITEQLNIYSDIASTFPPLDLPVGFTVIGSVDMGYRRSVAFDYGMDTDVAEQSLLDALSRQEWLRMPVPDVQMPTGGFIRSGTPRIQARGTQLCHDLHGTLTLNFGELDGRRYVTLAQSGGFSGNRNSCADQVEQYQRSMAMRERMESGLRQYLPRLVVPDEAGPQGYSPFVGGGSSGSMDEIEVDTGLAIDWEISEVYEHFAEQIVAQGWMEDTSNVGSISATGVWTRSPGQDATLIGSLTVLQSSEGRYDLKFKLVRNGAGRAGGAVFRGF